MLNLRLTLVWMHEYWPSAEWPAGEFPHPSGSDDLHPFPRGQVHGLQMRVKPMRQFFADYLLHVQVTAYVVTTIVGLLKAASLLKRWKWRCQSSTRAPAFFKSATWPYASPTRARYRRFNRLNCRSAPDRWSPLNKIEVRPASEDRTNLDDPSSVVGCALPRWRDGLDAVLWSGQTDIRCVEVCTGSTWGEKEVGPVVICTTRMPLGNSNRRSTQDVGH